MVAEVTVEVPGEGPGSGSNQTVNTSLGGGREREGKKLLLKIFLQRKLAAFFSF